MSDLLTELESRSTGLSGPERATLALHLLRSLEPADAEGWETAWLAEVEKRWAEFASGGDIGRPAPDVLATARAKLR